MAADRRPPPSFGGGRLLVRAGPTAHSRFHETSRGSRALRLARVRNLKCRLNPLCQRCEEEGKVVAAQLVHHIVPIKEGGAPYELGNLQSICYAHHNALHRGGVGGLALRLWANDAW